MIERCATYGSVAVTSSAPVSASANALTPCQIQKEHPLTEIPNATVVPIHVALEKIKTAAVELGRASPHPKSQMLIGIRAECLEQLQVVLARTESRQRSLDEKDLQATAREEVEDATSTYSRLIGLAVKAKGGKLTAEQFISAMRAEADPARASGAVHQMVTRRQTIQLGEHEVVTAESNSAASTVIELSAAESYCLRVTVHTINTYTGEVHCTLVGGERLDRLFSNSDINRRVLQLRVVGQALFMLSLCASVGAAVDIVASIRILVTSKGISHRCSLINFENLKRLSLELSKDIENRYGRLDGL